mgnify:CR=1 FL=1
MHVSCDGRLELSNNRAERSVRPFAIGRKNWLFSNTPLGAKIITAELAMRFLKDYLDGDVYFKIDYPTQNLDRCRTQLKLVADMEAKWPEMQRILHETAAVRCAQPTTPQ